MILIVLMLFPGFLFAQENISKQQENKKAVYDSLRQQNKFELQVLIRMKNDTALYIINNMEFPSSGIATTFNILKNKAGKILMVSVYPYCESGDWFVGFTHYFDEQGNTFAFERLTSFYNSKCTSGLANEKIIKYYSSTFTELKNTYSLTDSKNIPLKKSSCDLPYQFDYSVFKNVNEVYKQNHIPNPSLK